MKIKVLFLLFGLVILSCKNKTETSVDYANENLNVTTNTYPEHIIKVFDAHGGVDTWHTMQSLEFTIKNPDGNEVTITDLKSRHSLIEMPNHKIGFNGKEVWLKDKTDKTYKGNSKFYYNLMFYFYAMPFILADDGIHYENVDPLVFEGKSYPGIKITYEKGIGESPDDEYILYYDAETNKMAWLAYTVTYFSHAKSKEFNFIKYSDWQTVEGLLLPKTITWYNQENNVPTAKRNDVTFSNIKISKTKPNAKIFEVVQGSKIIE